jgi:hypothetical protein
MLDYAVYPNLRMVESVRNYLEHGVPPGGFLTALLCNDLCEVCRQADDDNRCLLFATVSWFYNEAPPFSWGDAQRVKDWIVAHEKRRAGQHK